MSEPTAEEINKVLAEFEGKKVVLKDGQIFKSEKYMEEMDCGMAGVNDVPLTKYTEDLNTLVPIWEKLGGVFFDGELETCGDKCPYFCVDKELRGSYLEQKAYGGTIQLAAATATYMAVQKVKDGV